MTYEPFFDLARERYSIFLKRQAGEQKPWTQDEILRQFKFCNVFREDDATTIWIKENIREPLRDDPKVFQAMVLARWFNRISTLDVLKDLIVSDAWSTEEARARLEKISPIFTAAYLIRSPKGMDKLTGVLWSIEQVLPQVRKKVADLVARQHSLEEVTEWLAQMEGLGHFMAYEVVTDLRHTFLLEEAPDIMSWANPGPGCEEGIRRLLGTPAGGRSNMIAVMQEILELSQDPENWPAEYPALEMRDVEHVLCEVGKYLKTKAGEGTPKQLFDGGGPRTIMYGQGRPATRRAPLDPTEAFIRKKMEAEYSALEVMEGEVAGLIVAAAERLVEQSGIRRDWLPNIETILVTHEGRVDEYSVVPPRRLPAYLEDSGAAPEELDLEDSELVKVEELKGARARVEAKEKKLREALADLD